MKCKKTFCLTLAFFMLSASVSAYAAKTNTITKVSALCDLPKISVSVPATGKILINPYKMSMTVGDNVLDDQIVSIPGCIKNESSIPLQVGVTVSGAVKANSNMLLSNITTEGTNLTSKSAFLYFEIKAADSETPDDSIWESEYDAEKHVVVGVRPSSKKNIVKLGAEGNTGSYGAFRLTGDCVASPSDEWKDSDGVDVEVAFTFTPLSVDAVINQN